MKGKEEQTSRRHRRKKKEKDGGGGGGKQTPEKVIRKGMYKSILATLYQYPDSGLDYYLMHTNDVLPVPQTHY